MSRSAAAFDAGQRLLLERIAQGAPLGKVLSELVRLVEQQAAGMACTILLVDAQHGTVHPIAAPSLPASYTSGLEGAKIGPEAGSCGAAAFRKERVIVADIATHAYWRDYKQLALDHGLRACWSTPILTAEQAVLGTFAMYYREPREPTSIEMAWVDAATHVATIAILRDRSERVLRASELRYRELAYKLDERIKELTLIHNAARVLQQERPVDQALVDELVALVPAAFQFPELCEARIAYGELAAQTPAFEYCAVRTRATFETAGPSGVVEVGYVREPFESGVDPFLPEERELLRSLSDMLATCFGRFHAERARRRLEERLAEAERLKSLGTLAGGIAHDFNNILIAVRGHTELALLESRDNAIARRSLEEVRNACLRANKLVRQILTFGQRAAPNREAVALRAMVDEALGLIASTLPSNVELRTRLSNGAHYVWADATQIHQVLLNVATNAIQAMESRSGVVEITLEGIEVSDQNKHLDLATGQYARLRVTDQGVGMSREVLSRAFDPFFTTKPQGTGTGLGLSVVHGIMKSHEGAVSVETEEGRGTTFELYFPTASRARVEESRAQRPSASNGERVLYVDDDEALVVLTVQLLKHLGYRATGMSDSREALALFRSDPRAFDLVISDVNMPKLSGPELVRELRQLVPGLRTVLVTSAQDVQASSHGEILAKPSTLEDLTAVLQRALAPGRAPALDKR